MLIALLLGTLEINTQMALRAFPRDERQASNQFIIHVAKNVKNHLQFRKIVSLKALSLDFKLLLMLVKAKTVCIILSFRKNV